MNENKNMIPYIDCFNTYKRAKKDVLNLNEIKDEPINEFFNVIDNNNCDKYLRNFSGFENSIKKISDFLYEKSPLFWTNLLIGKIFDNFPINISGGDKENLFKDIKSSESAVAKDYYRINSYKPSFFICIFQLFTIIDKIKDVKLLEEFISRINERNRSSEKIDIFIFWITMRILIKSENIKWRDKEYIFWNWNKNPYFNFFKKENFKTFESIYKFEIFKTNENIYIYNFIELLKSIKNIDDNGKECLRKKFLEQVISSLNKDIKESLEIVDKVYFDFDELSHLQENLRFNLANADFLNLIMKNIIPIKKEEEKKLKEVCSLYELLKDYDYKEEIEIVKTESPDFIIETKNNKKIGIELIRIESEEEHKNRTDYHSGVIWINHTGSDLIEQVITKIKKKFEKCKKYDEKRINGEFAKLWLYVHFSISSETFIKNIIFDYKNKNNTNPLNERIKDLANDANNCFNVVFWNNHKIFLK